MWLEGNGGDLLTTFCLLFAFQSLQVSMSRTFNKVKAYETTRELCILILHGIETFNFDRDFYPVLDLVK